MKPLELNIYEKHPDTDAYRVGGFYSPYCLVSEDKRFTGAELAAEFWRMRYDHKYEMETVGKARALVVERFGALPHAADADYE